MAKNHKRTLEPKWLLVGTFFASGVFLGSLGFYLWASLTPASLRLHPPKSDYLYINPLLGVDTPTRFFEVSRALELVVQGTVNASKEKKDIYDASVYYRDLESGEWVGSNENASFSPGKLLKIPIMIAYYRLAESNPDLLSEVLVDHYATPPNAEVFPIKDKVVMGKGYTIDELINRMITSGDDIATEILFDNIDKTALSEVYSDLGVSFSEDKAKPDYISIKLNSIFLRVLYNSTYLSREFSEKALAVLGKVNDNVLLVSGLPKDLPVSRRFGGSKHIVDNALLYTVYDCGIVYYPEHPYLLCASATGETLEGAETFMKTLGEKIYTEVKYKYKG